MLPHEWFGVGLRIVGVVVVLYGSAYLLDSLLFRLGYIGYPETHFSYYFIFGLSYLVAGFYLIWGAPHIVRLAYPEAADEYEDDEGDEGDDEEKTRMSPR